MKNKLLTICLLLLPLGCTVTGPADDGYERSNEWVDNGRLLADDTKEIYNTDTVQNYTTYQQWLQARDQNSSEYQKFKQWQEFEEFQRWKEKQNSE